MQHYERVVRAYGVCAGMHVGYIAERCRHSQPYIKYMRPMHVLVHTPASLFPPAASPSSCFKRVKKKQMNMHWLSYGGVGVVVICRSVVVAAAVCVLTQTMSQFSGVPVVPKCGGTRRAYSTGKTSNVRTNLLRRHHRRREMQHRHLMITMRTFNESSRNHKRRH